MSSVACAYMLVVYYSTLLSWVCNAFFALFGPSDPYTDGEQTSGEEAVKYFLDNIIGMGTLGEDLRPTCIVWTNVGYSTLTWICIFCCLAFGLKWTGRIAYITMGIPIVLLFVFLIRACTLTGASNGIRAVSVKQQVSCIKSSSGSNHCLLLLITILVVYWNLGHECINRAPRCLECSCLPNLLLSECHLW